MRAFHNKAMMKEQIYDNIPVKRSGMDCSPGICFQTSLVNMDKTKALTTRNQPEKKQQKQFWCVSTKHLRITSNDFLLMLAIRRVKKLTLRIGISQAEAKKSEEDSAPERRSKFLAAEVDGGSDKSYVGALVVNLESNMYAEAAESTEDGSFW